MRLTRVASDEASPAMAATAGTEATADFGRLKTVSIGKSPIHVPPNQSWNQGRGSYFFFAREPEPIRGFEVVISLTAVGRPPRYQARPAHPTIAARVNVNANVNGQGDEPEPMQRKMLLFPVSSGVMAGVNPRAKSNSRLLEHSDVPFGPVLDDEAFKCAGRTESQY
jgi:hypothetical protein